MSLNQEVRIVIVGVPGVNGTGITDAEKSQITSDLATLVARPAITGLAAVPNVSYSGLADGKVLVYDNAAGQWVPGDVSGAISGVLDVASGVTFSDISTLGATNGMHAADGGTGIAYIMPTFGGTGSQDLVSRSDHTHNPVIMPPPQTFAATGSLSSGTRTLLTYNAGPLLNGVVYDCKARVVVTVRNDISAGVVNLGLRIGASASFPTTTHAVRNVGGVDSQHEHVFVRSDSNGGAITGTGATVAVTATVAFDSGDPTSVRHGWVEFEAHPRR